MEDVPRTAGWWIYRRDAEPTPDTIRAEALDTMVEECARLEKDLDELKADYAKDRAELENNQ